MQNTYFRNYSRIQQFYVVVIAIFLVIVTMLWWNYGRSASAAPPTTTKKVLIIYPKSMAYPFYLDFTSGFKQRLQEDSTLKVEYSYESIDMFLNDTVDDGMIRATAEVLRKKYKDAPPI
ncbi:MAG: hypothetical protein P4N41_14045 [Negativicutes bacterium]|nr:hypothetical protein [Negativicutes bacterium]